MVDITDRIEDLDAELVSSVVQIHQDSGLEVLLAPPKPEMADVITENHVKRLFETLRPMYDFAIVDTSSSLNDVTLTMLDNADRIVLITQQTLPSLKNISRFYDLTDSLSYEPSKIWLMVNRTASRYGISVKDVASALKRPVIGTIPGEDLLFDAAADQGVPVVLQQSRRQPITSAFAKLVDHAIEDLKQDGNEAGEAGKPGGIFGRLFGRKSE